MSSRESNIILWLASNPGIEDQLSLLGEKYQVIRFDVETSQEEYPRENVIGIVTNTAPKFFLDLSFFDEFKDLEFVASPSTGVTHFCFKDLIAKGIKVFTIKDRPVLSDITSSSEHACFLVLATIRKARMAFDMAMDGTWRDKEDELRTVQLNKKTIGIIGLGRIGGTVAKVFQSLGMFVTFYDPYVYSESYYRVNSLSELFKNSSLVVVSCTLTDETTCLVDRQSLSSFRGGYLVNVARGEIVNEDDIIEALDLGLLHGYTTDVLSSEISLGENSVILKRSQDNRDIIVTPHCAGLSYDSEFLAGTDIINQILEI